MSPLFSIIKRDMTQNDAQWALRLKVIVPCRTARTLSSHQDMGRWGRRQMGLTLDKTKIAPTPTLQGQPRRLHSLTLTTGGTEGGKWKF